jgi:excisionase family DNA binding protein
VPPALAVLAAPTDRRMSERTRQSIVVNSPQDGDPQQAIGRGPSRPVGEPEYYLPEEIATKLRVSVKTVYRWMKAEPTMPALKIGGAVRFPRERFDRWLRENEQGHRTWKPVLSSRKSAPGQETASA